MVQCIALAIYWTPYRGIEMLICFPGKGSGGGVVYGFGVWRVKSWVKNVLNTNKYIAIFSIKWGWSPLTYLPLVVIIFEKSIILFYWTPYRGIETTLWYSASHLPSIEPLIGGLKCSFAFLERGAVEELFTGLECGEWRVELKTFLTQTNISRFFQ